MFVPGEGALSTRFYPRQKQSAFLNTQGQEFQGLLLTTGPLRYLAPPPVFTHSGWRPPSRPYRTSISSKSSSVTTLGYPFAHVNRVFRPLTLGQISPSGSLLYPQKRPFPPRITYFTHPEPRLHFPRHQTVTESHSEDFIIEFGVAFLSCLTPTALDGDPPGGRNLPLKSHLSWFSFSAPTQLRQAGEALLDPLSPRLWNRSCRERKVELQEHSERNGQMR